MTQESTRKTLDETIAIVKSKLTRAAMDNIASVFVFHFKDLGESQTLDARVHVGQGWIADAPHGHQLTPDFQVTLSSADFANLVHGRLHPMAGMATGRMKLTGSIKEALKLDRLLKS
jgi:putative sterol carrier protein